ncbi:MAG: D-alanyl-D-alanine carboxypeptidase family protein, partial [Minisyncoccia bacterium]
MKENIKKINFLSWFLIILIIFLLALKYFFDFKNFKNKEINYLNEIAKLNELNLTKSKEIEKLNQEKNNLNQILSLEQSKNKIFEDQINFASQKIRELQKISSLDKELLKKYSKVYFLNENYAPKKISLIDSKYIYNSSRQEYIHSDVLPFLEALLSDADMNGLKLKIISAYRSFVEQRNLKSEYNIVYGSGANKFSADQGYSEHQLGTTVDFTTNDLGANFSNFAKTKEYNWLLNNAYKYG